MSSSDSDNDSVPQKVAPKKGAAKSAAVAPASKAGDKRKAAKDASDSDSDSGSEDEQAKPAAEEEEEEVSSTHTHSSCVPTVILALAEAHCAVRAKTVSHALEGHSQCATYSHHTCAFASSYVLSCRLP
jgi:hypothetical protein